MIRAICTELAHMGQGMVSDGLSFCLGEVVGTSWGKKMAKTLYRELHVQSRKTETVALCESTCEHKHVSICPQGTSRISLIGHRTVTTHQ